MPQFDDPKQHINTLTANLNAVALAPKVKQLTAETSAGVTALDLTQTELSALNLPSQYMFGKAVRLPSNFRPPQEIHLGAAQLTGVISGELTWIQGNETTEKTVLTSGMAIHTPANIWHGHATNSSPVILVAVFTAHNPPKDQVRETDWKKHI